ncbi:Calcium-transporting ATPase [Bertholletia excelsa]
MEQPQLAHGVPDVECQVHPPSPPHTGEFTLTNNLDANSSDVLSQYDGLGGVAAALPTHLNISIVGDDDADYVVELGAQSLSHPRRAAEFFLDQKGIAANLDDNSSDFLFQYGGLEGVAAALRTHLGNGIVGDDDDLGLRKAAFGSNQLPGFDPVRIIFNFLKDTYTILLFAATLSVMLGIVEHGFKTGWRDGVMVFLVVLISGFIQLRKARNQFRTLTVNNSFDVYVVRNGQSRKLPSSEIVVGDVVILGPGDRVPADGLFISSDPSFKLGGNPQAGADRHRFPAVRCGEKVVEGNCRILIMSVGANKAMLTSGADYEKKSPSLVEFDRLLATMEKVVIGLSVVILVVQLLIYFPGKSAGKNNEVSDKDATRSSTEELLNEAAKVIRKNSGMASRLLATFGILFMGVREGGHLGISICFLFWKRKLKKCDANVVNLQACSSIGLVTNIYSSETVDLTLEHSKMAELWIGETMVENDVVSAGVAGNVLCSLREGVGLNAYSLVDDALLSCAQIVLGVRVEELEQSCSIVRRENTGFDGSLWGLWLRRNAEKEKSVVHIHYNGPPRKILSMCSDYYDVVGERHPMDTEKRVAFEKICERIAAEDYLDCIAFAYRQHEEEDEGEGGVGCGREGGLARGCGGTQRGEGDELGVDDEEHPKHGKQEMTLLALIALKNPYTKELKQSFEACQNAGINITLVLNIDMSIARLVGRNTGLIHAADDTSKSIVEAHEIRESPLTKKIDDIRILANSSPSDKLLLVQLQRERGKVVAFAGNTSKDLPSLREANVGFWVGEGREERSDIVISNKTFVSLSATLQRGRFIHSNIQKFAQLHLTAIIVGTAVNFGTAFSAVDTLISPVQFLWVSLVVDILGALALATDLNGGTEFSLPLQSSGLVATRAMWRNVGFQALYQTAIILALQFGGKKIMDVDNSAMDFVVFNTYFLCQVSCLLNARQVERSNFSGKIYKNWMFTGLVALMVALQLGVVEVLLAFRHQQRLVSTMWLVPAAVAGLSLPVGCVAKRIPVY